MKNVVIAGVGTDVEIQPDKQVVLPVICDLKHSVTSLKSVLWAVKIAAKGSGR